MCQLIRRTFVFHFEKSALGKEPEPEPEPEPELEHAVFGCSNGMILTGRVNVVVVGIELLEFESPESARFGALGDAYVISMRTTGA